MTEKDYASADVMVLGLVATCMAGGNEAAYIMQAIQKFGVKTNWFHSVQHQRFFDAVLQTWKDINTLDLFHVKKRFDGEGFNEVIEGLIDAAPPTIAYLESYLRALKEKYIYTIIHKMMYTQLQELKPENIGIQVEDFVKNVHDIQEELADHDSGLRQISDFMEESIAMKRKLHEERFVNHNWEFMDGVPYPWHEVNQIFSGLKTGLHIIGALASQGKSTMAVDLSVFWNVTGIKHGYISIDMAAEQFVDRYPCASQLVSLAKLNFGGSGTDIEKFERGFREQAKYNNMWISEADDTKTIEYQCYRGVRTLGWKTIIIDYIQLVTYEEGKGNLPEYTRVQRCVQAIKKMAKKLKVPIVCLAQLSRAFEKELRDAISGGKAAVEPGLDAIGDSAEIARAAASVTVLYQDENVRRYWKENPPTQLAFGDKDDKAVDYGIVSIAEEEEIDREKGLPVGTTTNSRRNGQMSLARSLRPVWFEVLKNQQGGKGLVPFVMFANYFLFRPGNSDGEDVQVEVGGKQKVLPLGKFEQLRDDWVYTEQDWWLEMTGAMPQRGVKLMGETYAEMRVRQAAGRDRHRNVRHFVRDYAEDGRTLVGEHWEEAK